MRDINAYTPIIGLLQATCNRFATLMTWVDPKRAAITSVDTFTTSGCAGLAAGPGDTRNSIIYMDLRDWVLNNTYVQASVANSITAV
jgi:hypothetical protein